MKKVILLICVLFLSQNVQSAGQGIHIELDFNNDMVEEEAVGSGSYYFQDGNFLADVDMQKGAVDNITMLEKNGVLYSLFKQEKKYMEVSSFMTGVVSKMSQKQSTLAFKATGVKKTIAGWDCEVFERETTTSKDQICLNQPLYEKYKDMFTKMQNLTGSQSLTMGAKGFPLEVSSIGQKSHPHKITMLVKKIEEQNFNNKFEIPQDYTEKNAISGAIDMIKKLTIGE